jgi:hypothetical protein
VARKTLGDVLQNHAFWLMDLAPIGAGSIPLFAPLGGFSSITAPEIQVETEEITEGNWYYKTPIVKRAQVSPITLKKGSTWQNADFYRWINSAIRGNTVFESGSFAAGQSLIDSFGGPTYRRNLLLIQFLRSSPINLGDVTSGVQQAAAIGVLAGAGIAAGAISGGAASAVASGVASGVSLGIDKTIGGELPLLALRIPAKAWVLYECIPTRYKASGDFDAMSASVSIQELEIKPSYIEEISLFS